MSKTSMPISGNLTQVEAHLLQKKARQYLMMKNAYSLMKRSRKKIHNLARRRKEIYHN